MIKLLLKAMLIYTILMVFTYNAKAYNFKSIIAEPDTDYVVTNKGDTIKCSISISLLGKMKYSVAGGKSVDLSPEDIQELYVSRRNLFQHSRVLPGKDKPEFINIVEVGKINIYVKSYTSAAGFGGTTSNLWYMQKGSGEVILLKTNSVLALKKDDRKSAFEEAISDNKKVYERFLSKKKFTFDNIRSLIHLYNTDTWVDDWSGF